MKCRYCGKKCAKQFCSLGCQMSAHQKKLDQVGQVPKIKAVEEPVRTAKPRRYRTIKGKLKAGGRARLFTPVRVDDGTDWTAQMEVNGERWCKRFSTSVYGEKGARLAAALQKMLWAIELGVWNVEEDGNPFGHLGFFDDQKDTVEGVSSPFIQEKDDW
jgi:hypothetical protein